MSLAALGLGIVIGALIDRDSKLEMVNELRKATKRLFKEAEEWEKETERLRKTYDAETSNSYKRTSYKEYYCNRQKEEKEDHTIRDEKILSKKVELLRFKTKGEAETFLDRMRQVANRDENALSMLDLAMMRQQSMIIDYTWAHYVWTWPQIMNAHVSNFADYSEIIIADPRIFDLSKE